MVAQPKHYYTLEEYLALERAAEYKSEYLDGQILAMSVASKAHNIITAHLVRLLDTQFDGQPCQVYGSDMRVRVSATGLYTYPDVSALCGAQQFSGAHQDSLLNPMVIFEVLSPSTELYDRTEKFDHYRRLESLTNYVLVAQDRVRVDHYTLRGDSWILNTITRLDETLHLTAIDAALPLAFVYANVEFPPRTSLRPEARPGIIEEDS